MVRAEGLHRSYGTGAAAVHALRGVSFSVPRGELVALKGRSGSGKTALLNLVGGLDRPDAGTVEVDGLDLAELAITSGVTLAEGDAPPVAFTLEDVPSVAVLPGLAEGEKCVRCWQVLPEVAASPEHLCRRCTAAVATARAA